MTMGRYCPSSHIDIRGRERTTLRCLLSLCRTMEVWTLGSPDPWGERDRGVDEFVVGPCWISLPHPVGAGYQSHITSGQDPVDEQALLDVRGRGQHPLAVALLPVVFGQRVQTGAVLVVSSVRGRVPRSDECVQGTCVVDPPDRGQSAFLTALVHRHPGVVAVGQMGS